MTNGVGLVRRKATNSGDIKTFNRVLVRNIIRRLGPIARYELAEETGLTPPTVTVIVNELIDSGLVMEVGFGESSGGRRPVMLELVPNAAYVFAVKLQRDEAVVALCDIGGNVLNHHRWSLDTSCAQEVVDAVGNSFDWLVDSNGINKEKVLYCGVACPGVINTYRGLIKGSTNMDWRDVPLGAMLSKCLYGMPVQVQNISNAAAFAEIEYGIGRGYRDMVYLNLSVGVGAGIITDGEIYGGSKGYAGEIGHIPIEPDGGPRCTCGRHGCFEAICGVRAIVERCKEALPLEFFEQHALNKAKINIMDVLVPPLVEREEVQAILEEGGQKIGVVVATLVNIFNPELIILGGELSKAGPRFTQAVIEAANGRILKEFFGEIKVMNSMMEKDPSLMGAYALALNTLFSIEEWYS